MPSKKHNYIGYLEQLPIQSYGALTELEHKTGFDVLLKPSDVRLTKLVCTIGPATRDVEKLVELIDAGMNIARLNFSHGNHDYHLQVINNIREACALRSDKVVAIALDTKGPEIRTGFLKDGASEILLEKDKEVRVTCNTKYKEEVSSNLIYVDYMNITNVIKPQSRIFIDDGNICLRAINVGKDEINCLVEVGGIIKNQKGVNLPGTPVDLPAVTEKDKEDLRFGVVNQVDFVFASFIRDGAGIREIRKVLQNAGEHGKNIKVIAKVENQQGIDNYDEILAEADGIMVARGDMGVEIEPEQVYVAQRMMIAKAQCAGKPVICATQMLDSMTKKPRPTRAEVSDVGFAVSEGADAIMLSGETANGDYPVECVKMQDRISRTAETTVAYAENTFQLQRLISKQPVDCTMGMAIGAVNAALATRAIAIIVLSNNGRSVEMTCQLRPRCPIICVTRNVHMANHLCIRKACIPVLIKEPKLKDIIDDQEYRIKRGIEELKKLELQSKQGDYDLVVVMTGAQAGMGYANVLKIMLVTE